jgi:hypothetical protein
MVRQQAEDSLECLGPFSTSDKDTARSKDLLRASLLSRHTRKDRSDGKQLVLQCVP